MSWRAAALLLTVLTGFSGLVYEVTWEKYLATLLGSHSEATAAVLGLFLGGLALGYALFGRVTRALVARAAAPTSRLLIVYGILEAGIGVYALLFPFFFEAVQALSFLVPHGGAGFVLDIALSALLIGPPAVLMGGTIPMLTQALARGLEDATRFHARVYALNTAGAFAGALAAGFWLIPQLGLVRVLVAMAVINLGAGAVFFALGARQAAKLAPGSPEQARSDVRLGADPAAAPRPDRLQRAEVRQLALVALLGGFAMMSLQTVLIRLGGLSLGASQFTFSMVVAVFVLCIALGSFAVSALRRIPQGLLAASLWTLVLLLALLYALVDDAPYWAHVLRTRFPTGPDGFYPYHLGAFAALLGVIGLPVALSGATLPLIFDHLRNRYGELGDVAGRLYSWNTLGSLLGALLGGYALLLWLDLHHVFRLAVAALVVSATIATRGCVSAGRRPLAAAIALPALVVLALLPAWAPEQLASGLFRQREQLPLTAAGPAAFFADRRQGFELIFYDDDPAASVAVGDEQLGDGVQQRFLVVNGKPDGAMLTDYVTMSLLSLIPALLAEKLETAFVIGWGTGVSVGSYTSLESVKSVSVAEISPAVMRAAPLFEGNGDPLAHPGLRVIQSDAYRALIRSPERYDVITSEPSNPWVTGVEMLFTREFLEAARDHLAPGGVYGQWFHLYETDAATVEMVLRTYASVFEHVSVWYTKGDDLLLLGLTDPDAALDLERMARRAAQPDFSAALRRAGIDGLPALLAHELWPMGVVHATPMPGELHELLNPRLSTVAARAFYAGGEGRVPATAHLEAARVGARHSLLRRYVADRGGSLPEDERTALVYETCKYRPRECATLLAQWTHDVPESAARAAFRIPRRADRSQRVDPGMVSALSRLYDEAPALPSSVNALALAQQASGAFLEFHHHGAPFSRKALAYLWGRCEEDPSRRERCQRAREEVTARLGDLSPVTLR